jgi:hypothetical protein
MAIAISSGMLLTPARLNALIPLVAVKTADESVVSSTTFQDDDHMSLTVQAGARYRMMMLLLIGGASLTPDLKLQIVMPSGATLSSGGIGKATSDVLNVGGLSTTSSPVGPFIFGTPASGTDNALISGDLIVGGTGGTVKIQWAQQTNNAAAAILRTGSWLELRRYL